MTTADGQWQLNVSISKKANAEDAKSVFGLFSIDPFDKIKAIGFTFAEVDKADIPVPQIEFALTPKSGTEMDVLDSLTLTFTGYHRIDLADDSKVYLKGDSIVQPVSIELAENSQTQYVMCFGALDVLMLTLYIRLVLLLPSMWSRNPFRVIPFWLRPRSC